MKFGRFALVVGLLVLLLGSDALAQFKSIGFEMVEGGGVVMDNNSPDGAKPGLKVRVGAAWPLLDPLQLEVGLAYAELRAAQMHTVMMPLDLRLRFSPFHTDKWIPFVYAGVGALYHDMREKPDTVNIDAESWHGVIPAGLGVQYRIDEIISLDVHAGFNQSTTKNISLGGEKDNDSYLIGFAGLRFAGRSNPDLDNDGLTNKAEKELGTDPRNPDTDGDGLQDGAEINEHHTNALNPDTDGDTLRDGDEILTHKTNPNLTDTDKDGLTDAAEVQTTLTDPLKADTDGDGLGDGAEVDNHKTDPKRADTDGDDLADGDEVTKYVTNPLAADTDGGSVADGAEVKRGTSPVVAADDVPKFKLEVGKEVVLEGIVFAVNSAEILRESEVILNDALNSLKAAPEVVVEIHGHTDNTGGRPRNMELSLARANSVRDWLVAKGIAADRLSTKGFGPDRPTASNATPEGKQKNRRIQFVRTK